MNVFELFARILLDTSEFENGLSDASASFKKAGESISSVGSTLTKSVTLPVVGVGAAILKTGMDYEAGMSKVQAISGATGAEMDMLGDKAMEMAKVTKWSTADSAEAYQYMAMAGWKASDMVDGLSGIMNLAAASGESLGATSDIVTDALTAFGLTAADSGRFADVLAAASNNANTNVSMLGESFKYVAPVAGALGYSVEDTSVALGLMANSGIKASSAGTALRTVLTNMSKPTNNMAAAMDALGVSLEDDEGNMYSLMEVMLQLREGFGGGSMSAEDFSGKLAELDEQFISGAITQEEYDSSLENLMESMYGVEGAQKAELASMLAGKEGMSGLLAIVNSTEEDFNKLTAAINNSNGTAEEMAKVMQDNAAGAFERLKSAINVLFTQLSEHLIPIFITVVEKLTEWVNWFGQLDESTQKTIITIAAVAAAIGPVLIAIGKVITAVGTIISAISKIGPVISAVKTAVSGLFAVLAANPIALVIAAITALVAAFVLLWNNCDAFRDFWINLWTTAKESASAAWDAITEAFSAAWDAITEAFSAAWDAIKGTWGGAVDFFSGIWEGIQNVFSAVGEVLGGVFSDAWEIAKSAWDTAAEFFSGIASNISSVFSGIKDVIGGAFKSAWEAVKGAWDGVTSFFSGVVENIKSVFKNAASSFFSIGKNIVDGIKNGISEAWSALTSWVKGKFESLVNGVKSTLGIHSPSTVFAGIGGNMALGVGEGWSSEYSGIKAQIERGLNFGTATVGLNANANFSSWNHGGLNAAPAGRSGDTYNFYSPTALDPVSAAREMKKAKQQLAMSYL